jgi:hypothetical protein
MSEDLRNADPENASQFNSMMSRPSSVIVTKSIVIVVMAAAVILPLAIVALPESPPDINTEMQRLSLVENEIYDTFNGDQELLATGVIDDVEFANRIESNVLPAWIKLRENVESFLTLEDADKGYLEKLIRYLRSREENWQLLVQGLREKDDEKIQRAYQLSIESREKLKDEIQSSYGIPWQHF